MGTTGGIEYKAGYKYQLVNTYSLDVGICPEDLVCTQFIILYPSGQLSILTGYAWDGPSGPAIDTTNFMRGSLIHDALYQLIDEGHIPSDYKKQADKLLRQICIEDGMSRIRAWWVYNAVKLFGGRDPAPKPIYYT
jgi:hypothetical protein